MRALWPADDRPGFRWPLPTARDIILEKDTGMKSSLFLVVIIVVCVPPAQASDNILLNPGCEEGKEYPLHWREGGEVAGVEYIWDREKGCEGKASLCLHKTAKRYVPIAGWYQAVVREGESPSLEISAQVRAEEVSKAVVDVAFLDSNGKRISYQWASYIGSRNADDPPADHDWKAYSGLVSIPEGTERIEVWLQIYGPGKVWFDDVRAVYSDAAAPPPEKKKRAPKEDEFAGIESEKLQAAKDPKKTYFLIRPADDPEPPKGGYKLLVVLPGGDGSEGFHPFVKRIYKNGLPGGYLAAQLVAVKWTDGQKIVWPHDRNKAPKMKFTTEKFIEAVVADVKKRYEIDKDFVFTLSWSSSGPAAYAASLQRKKSITGSYISMSVFKSNYLPSLSRAKGHRYYIEHSPDDSVCPFWMAEKAEEELSKKKAKVTLSTYQGGHGWSGDVYGRIRKGIDWLETNAPK